MNVKAGRPRNKVLDAALLAATCDLLAEGGVAAATTASIAQRAGTTKPALYRRFRGRHELLVASLVDRFGADPTVDTGSLREDLEALQRHQLELFGDPVITRGFAGLLAELDADRALAQQFVSTFLAPRRAATALVLERAAERGEIKPYGDPEWICDLITGPLLMRAALPGLPPLDARLAAQTVHAALTELGAEDGPELRRPV